MSTQRGNATRTRCQKHKNRTAFKNDLHDKTPLQIRLNAMHISEVCQHCKGVIEWKIKYKKYKPLSQPKTCTRCQQRNIKKAYHVLCRGCAIETRVCAKCLKSAEEVEIEPPQPTPEEALKLKVEMERLVKSFPERKRRAFLRYMEKGKLDEEEGEANDAEREEAPPADGDEEEEPAKPKRIPHSRDELLKKIEQLKLTIDEDDEDDDDFTDEEEEDEEDESDLEGAEKTEEDPHKGVVMGADGKSLDKLNGAVESDGKKQEAMENGNHKENPEDCSDEEFDVSTDSDFEDDDKKSAERFRLKVKNAG